MVGSDGKTPMARVAGTQCTRTIAEFGEQILFKKSSKNHKHTSETQWSEGTFLGIRSRSGAVVVADKGGVVKRCCTIRARPPADRWRADRILGIKDSVAVGVYRFAKSSDADSDEEEGEADAGEDEGAVADLFMSDGEDDQVVCSKNEPTYHSRSSSDAGPQDSVDDPDRLNLLSGIKELEQTLSKDRMAEHRRINMMVTTGADITEVFSLPRIAAAAKEMGLLPGESIDLLTVRHFSKSADRQKAIQQIREQKPFLVVGSPPCTLFSGPHGLNKHKLGAAWAEKFRERKKDAIKHTDFCAAIYKLQSASGRY